MKAMRYVRLLWVQVRTSTAAAMQYRIDFLFKGAMAFVWLAWGLIPLMILFGSRQSVAGWTFEEALVVMGWFTVLRGFLEGAINPSLIDVVDRIRTGTFDYLLIKPADSQFMVSTARFAPWKLVDVIGGFAVVFYALHRIGYMPSGREIALATLLLISAMLSLYSLWILILSASFWVVRIDNLTYLFSSIFDAGRWPIEVFRGAWRFVFTFVIPVALMTSYPAMALMGRLEHTTAIGAIAATTVFALVARGLWNSAIGHYTSASS